MTFAQRLKITRKECNLTQDEVAQKLGVTRATYSRYELGQREPNLDAIRELASIFNVSADFLINTNKYNKDVELNQTEQRLLDLFRQLNLQGQEYILQTLDMAKDKYSSVLKKSSDNNETLAAARGNSHIKVEISDDDIQKIITNYKPPEDL